MPDSDQTAPLLALGDPARGFTLYRNHQQLNDEALALRAGSGELDGCYWYTSLHPNAWTAGWRNVDVLRYPGVGTAAQHLAASLIALTRGAWLQQPRLLDRLLAHLAEIADGLARAASKPALFTHLPERLASAHAPMLQILAGDPISGLDFHPPADDTRAASSAPCWFLTSIHPRHWAASAAAKARAPRPLSPAQRLDARFQALAGGWVYSQEGERVLRDAAALLTAAASEDGGTEPTLVA